MLVLSRQRGEAITIGDDVEVEVVDIRGDKVRLGITAPKEIPVHRKEVYDAIRRESREAVPSGAGGGVVVTGRGEFELRQPAAGQGGGRG